MNFDIMTSFLAVKPATCGLFRHDLRFSAASLQNVASLIGGILACLHTQIRFASEIARCCCCAKRSHPLPLSLHPRRGCYLSHIKTTAMTSVPEAYQNQVQTDSILRDSSSSSTNVPYLLIYDARWMHAPLYILPGVKGVREGVVFHVLDLFYSSLFPSSPRCCVRVH